MKKKEFASIVNMNDSIGTFRGKRLEDMTREELYQAIKIMDGLYRESIEEEKKYRL